MEERHRQPLRLLHLEVLGFFTLMKIQRRRGAVRSEEAATSLRSRCEASSSVGGGVSPFVCVRVVWKR